MRRRQGSEVALVLTFCPIARPRAASSVLWRLVVINLLGALQLLVQRTDPLNVGLELARIDARDVGQRHRRDVARRRRLMRARDRGRR